jgi:hypothetical protein
MAKRRGRKKGIRGPGRGKSGPVYNKSKAGKDNRVPLPILQKRLRKLTRIVGERSGMRFTGPND